MGSVMFRIGDKVHMINDEDNKYEPKLFPKSTVIGEVLFVSMNRVLQTGVKIVACAQMALLIDAHRMCIGVNL